MTRAIGASSAPGSSTTRSTTSRRVRMPSGTRSASTTIIEPMPSSRIRASACAPFSSGAQALARMRELGIGSMIVVDADRVPLGILTLRDVVDRVVLEPGALDAPIARVMTSRLVTLPLDATAYGAALAMIRHGVRHIVADHGERRAMIRHDVTTAPGSPAS